MTIATASFDDVDHMQETADRIGYQSRYLQLGKGRFRLEFASRQLETLHVIQKTVGVKTEINGAPRDGHVTLIFSKVNEQFRLNGQFASEDALFLVPHGAEIDLVLQGGASLQSVTLPLKVLEKKLRDKTALLFGREGGGVKQLRFEGADKIGTSLLLAQLTESSASAESLDRAKSLFVEEAVRLISSSKDSYGSNRHSGSHSRRQLRRATSFIVRHLAEPIRNQDIIKQSGTSERALQRMFRAEYDMTPQQYLRVQRLEAARKRLVENTSKTINLSSIALSVGYTHFGRFSGDFRQQFGVLPSRYSDFNRP